MAGDHADAVLRLAVGHESRMNRREPQMTRWSSHRLRLWGYWLSRRQAIVQRNS
jgi:hypothetical protein